jgi:hypothetical protein
LKIDSRTFSIHGFEVALTQASRDGGFDILAKLHNPATFVALVDCKNIAEIGWREVFAVWCRNNANQDSSNFFIFYAEQLKRPLAADELRTQRFNLWLGTYVENTNANTNNRSSQRVRSTG